MIIPELNLNVTDAYSALRPLALFAAGVAVYGILVFHFYRFLARKDILKLDLSKHNQSRRPLLRKIISVIFYILESLMLFPILIFFWFLVMAGLLFLMNSDRSIEGILLAAMGGSRRNPCVVVLQCDTCNRRRQDPAPRTPGDHADRQFADRPVGIYRGHT